MCQDLKCLPGPGALYDQDSLIVHGMDLVVHAQRARQKLEYDAEQAKLKPRR